MVEIDESEFPLIIVTYRGATTHADWEQLVAVTSKHFEARRRFALAFRMVDFKLAEFSLLKEMGDWTRDQADSIRRYLVRAALCTPSAMARGALNFINRLSNSPFEQRVFADWDEALAWARASFEGASSASER